MNCKLQFKLLHFTFPDKNALNKTNINSSLVVHLSIRVKVLTKFEYRFQNIIQINLTLEFDLQIPISPTLALLSTFPLST